VPKSLYLINPRAKVPGYYGADVFEQAGLSPAAGIADLAIVTVAALAPPDWEVTICDEHISAVDFDSAADFIGITGKITQSERILELASEFRARGKCVVIGGPHASLSPEVFRGRSDVLVIGELESIAPELFSDLEHGRWKSEYTAPKPDLSWSPIPRWDLYPTGRSLVGCVQTSRGCPFECEFCDVIQYLGRKQRHKPLPQVLAELDVLYQKGFRGVFLADDNFTVYRRRAKEILTGLRDWNRTRPGRAMSFTTQVSVDAARDPELLQLCGEAGITSVFVGIETPNQDSLRETKKRQNVGIDLIQQIELFLQYGISVTAGMMIGFDHDGPGIFEQQFDFAMESPVPIFTLSALVAPAATPLFARMKREARLTSGGDVAGSPWDTNIVPARMTRQELLEGLRWLCRELYRPENFTKRVLRMIDCLRSVKGPFSADLGSIGEPRAVESEALLVIQKIRSLGAEERRMIPTILHAMQEKPHSRRQVTDALYRYAQARCVYQAGGVWQPQPTTVSTDFVQLEPRTQVAHLGSEAPNR
jgi:radical SAM superfamily enzyme YgiQ (UPF0313 family)